MPAKTRGKVQLRILATLAETGPVWIGVLEERLGMRENEVRQPLLGLEQQGLVQADRSGKRTVWSLREQSS